MMRANSPITAEPITPGTPAYYSTGQGGPGTKQEEGFCSPSPTLALGRKHNKIQLEHMLGQASVLHTPSRVLSYLERTSTLKDRSNSAQNQNRQPPTPCDCVPDLRMLHVIRQLQTPSPVT